MTDAEEWKEACQKCGTYHMRPRPILEYHLDEFHQGIRLSFNKLRG